VSTSKLIDIINHFHADATLMPVVTIQAETDTVFIDSKRTSTLLVTIESSASVLLELWSWPLITGTLWQRGVPPVGNHGFSLDGQVTGLSRWPSNRVTRTSSRTLFNVTSQCGSVDQPRTTQPGYYHDRFEPWSTRLCRGAFGASSCGAL